MKSAQAFAADIREGERFLLDTERANTIHPDYARRVVMQLVTALGALEAAFAALSEMAELRRADELEGLLREMGEWCYEHGDGAPDAPSWCKDAGVFAERVNHLLRDHTEAGPEQP